MLWLSIHSGPWSDIAGALNFRVQRSISPSAKAISRVRSAPNLHLESCWGRCTSKSIQQASKGWSGRSFMGAVGAGHAGGTWFSGVLVSALIVHFVRFQRTFRTDAEALFTGAGPGAITIPSAGDAASVEKNRRIQDKRSTRLGCRGRGRSASGGTRRRQPTRLGLGFNVIAGTDPELTKGKSRIYLTGAGNPPPNHGRKKSWRSDLGPSALIMRFHGY